MPRPRKAVVSPTSPQEGFRVMLTMGNLVYEGTGVTFLEALAQINPSVFKTKGVFEVASGNLKASLLVPPQQMRRLGINQISREIFTKRVAMALK